MEQIKGRILVHSLIFPPDQVSTSYLYGDITLALIKSGYEVEVITTWPHYNYSKDFKSQSKRKLFSRSTNFYGARVHHVRQKKSNNFLVRGSYILWFHFYFLIKSMKMKRFDLIIAPSPPLTAGFLSGIIAKIRKSKSVYNVQEIYPDVMVKHGGLNSRILIAILGRIEKWTYQLNTKVVTIDPHFSEVIRSRLSNHKLTCIPNFIDTKLYCPLEKSTNKDLYFDDKFLVGYVGNLGKVQDWDSVIETAVLFQNNPRIAFFIVGGGSEFEKLKSYESKLSNWIVWPYQDREKVPQINSRINLHIISMNEASDYDGLPSKVFAILSSGKPILAATNNDSPLSKILKESQNGLVVKRSDPRAIEKGINKAIEGYFTSEKSDKGRAFVVNNYSKEVVTQKYVDLLDSLILGEIGVRQRN